MTQTVQDMSTQTVENMSTQTQAVEDMATQTPQKGIAVMKSSSTSMDSVMKTSSTSMQKTLLFDKEHNSFEEEQHQQSNNEDSDMKVSMQKTLLFDKEDHSFEDSNEDVSTTPIKSNTLVALRDTLSLSDHKNEQHRRRVEHLIDMLQKRGTKVKPYLLPLHSERRK